MFGRFPVFQSHLDLAHRLWTEVLKVGSGSIIDATCGNGHDTLFLAQKMGPIDKLYAIDLQRQAIESTQRRLCSYFESLPENVYLLQRCHSFLPPEITPGSVNLIVYNLGYLPSGDKNLTTVTSLTLKSLNHSLKLIKAGGAISITCYPGHAEGMKEEKAILDWSMTLCPKEWSVCVHRWNNRNLAPSLLFIQKSI